MNRKSSNDLLLAIIITGAVVGLALTLLSPKVVQDSKITDVKGLTTVSAELDNTNPDDLDKELDQLFILSTQ